MPPRPATVADIPQEWKDAAIVIPLTLGRARIVIDDGTGLGYHWPFW